VLISYIEKYDKTQFSIEHANFIYLIDMDIVLISELGERLWKKTVEHVDEYGRCHVS